MSAEGNPPNQEIAGSADFIVDDAGIILDIHATGENARLANGVSEGEGLCEYIHPADREFVALCRHWAMQSSESNAPPVVRLRWARTNGHYSIVYATFIAESSETLRVCITRDEVEQVTRSAAQLRRVAEGSLQGIVVRTSSEILFMNDAFARLTGYETARQLKSELSSMGPNGGIHPDDAPMIRERVRRRTAGEEEISHYQFRMMHREGGFRWVDTLATRIEWDGQLASLSWMADITDRRAMEAELLKSKEAAEFASRTKTEFLAHMSHELRTPLNAIIGFAEVIKGELFGACNQPKYVDYAADIHKSGEHLLDLINDILDLSKLEAGKLELRESDVVLPEIISQCCTLIRNRADQEKIKLVTEIPADVPVLRADPRALKQLLLNFLSNAIKFTPTGGSVTARVIVEPDGLRVEVSDTGIGMRPEDIAVALSPFGQIDSKMARQHHGTGLGLPICKSLVELHGGTLTLESAPGKGTTVIAAFPAERLVRAAA